MNKLELDSSGRYERKDLHAEGGLGCIYVVRDKLLEREVALKEIGPKQASQPEAWRRFVREAQVTGQLEHPNIVPVYELSQRQDDGRPFYTMKLVRGQTLREKIAEYHRRLGETRSIDYIRLPEEMHRRAEEERAVEFGRLLEACVSICQAVAYAHSRGVIHRDLKPDNVVLGNFGEVVVLDWGLAKMVDQPDDSSQDSISLSAHVAPTETMTGRILGTPAYMAPEQAEGRADLIGPRTDIYGLGAILFEIITGQPPHDGKLTVDVINKIITGPTPRARKRSAGANRALEAICGHAMAKDPQDRYGDARELAADLQRFLANEPVSCYVEPWTQQLTRWARRHRTYTMAFATACAAVIVTSLIAALLLARYADQEHAARLAVDDLRDQSIEVAARFAARSIANEIDLRWHILSEQAADPELVRILTIASAGPLAPDDQRALQAWIEKRQQQFHSNVKASSWFVTDQQGVQLARSPAANTIGLNFAYRDYFHGLGRDLTVAEAKGVPPITQVHRSVAFESMATLHQMIAFSVPIWDSDGETLGILAMTVELGRFSSLQVGLSEDQIVVLAETTEDWLEDTARRGLILHHPLMAEARLKQAEGQEINLPIYRLAHERVVELEELRTRRLEEDRDFEQLSWEKQSLLETPARTAYLVRDYQDPTQPDSPTRWLAAFEPVLVKGRAGRVRDTGWVVIVQERQKEDDAALASSP
ncbi:MAG: serine/threonine protein kinase [Gemmataceae bacterium]